VSIPRIALQRIVATALEEDLGSGDLTTAACIEPSAQGRAEMRARQPLVFCGGDVVREVFRQVDPTLQVEQLRPDATRLASGDSVLRVSGSATSILHGERVALNFVQRMSGIATRTRAFVEAVPAGCKTRIVDTRKTTPGLRCACSNVTRCAAAAVTTTARICHRPC
jgi:nicotinate-nucleotide pyrophosphorylase (carboxylating)